MIAALYVMEDGPYADLEGVETWPESRDARLYNGPWSVVGHPPCERWGRYWNGGPSAKVVRKLGDDAGCFAAALAAVQRFGGVIEHPEASHAWHRFGIPAPPKAGGWVGCIGGGWTCCVEQGNYGHKARKASWLYVRGIVAPPRLIWGPAAGCARLDDGYHTAEERKAGGRRGGGRRLTPRQCRETPGPFRDVLLSLARMVA